MAGRTRAGSRMAPGRRRRRRRRRTGRARGRSPGKPGLADAAGTGQRQERDGLVEQQPASGDARPRARPGGCGEQVARRGASTRPVSPSPSTVAGRGVCLATILSAAPIARDVTGRSRPKRWLAIAPCSVIHVGRAELFLARRPFHLEWRQPARFQIDRLFRRRQRVHEPRLCCQQEERAAVHMARGLARWGLLTGASRRRIG